MSYVDRAYLDLEGTTVYCTSITPRDAESLEAVKTMNPMNRAVGYTSGIPEYELSATVPLPKAGHAVDFYGIKKAGVEFTSTIIYPGGGSRTYLRCRITEIEQGSEEGSRTDTELSIMALDSFDG